MICIRCQRDCKYSERTDGNCPYCSGQFAFEPKNQALFTDKSFKTAIDNVSSEGKVRWGVEHLYYELCRRKRGKAAPGCLIILSLPVFVLVPLTILEEVKLSFSLGVTAVLGLIALIVYLTGSKQTVGLDRGDFEKLWDRWGQVHGKIPSLIQRKAREEPARDTRTAEPDLEDYSFDRAVICDRARTADLLLANKFHFENNCAVLSFDGYPHKAFEGVKRMLKRNPRLEVYALHDATVEGCRLAYRLATDPQWFKGQGRVIDVGLRPVHAGPFKGLLLPRDGDPVPAGQGISEEEAKWLSKYRLELAAVRPEQVLRRLFKAISRQPAGPSLAPASAAARGAATAGAAVGTAASLALAGAAAAHPPPKKAKDTSGTSSSGGGDSSSGDWGGEAEWSFDSESFSSDADASDGGADSFG